MIRRNRKNRRMEELVVAACHDQIAADNPAVYLRPKTGESPIRMATKIRKRKSTVDPLTERMRISPANPTTQTIKSAVQEWGRTAPKDKSAKVRRIPK